MGVHRPLIRSDVRTVLVGGIEELDHDIASLDHRTPANFNTAATSARIHIKSCPTNGGDRA